MRLMLSFSVFVLVLVMTNAKTLTRMSFTYGEANTELNIASKTAYMTYPGMDNVNPEGTVTLKLFKDDETAPKHSYIVPPTERENPAVFRFAINEATRGNYRAQLCHKPDQNTEESCSEKSSPPSPIEMGKSETDESDYQLSCLRKLDKDHDVSLKANLLSVSGWADEEVINKLVNNKYSVAKKYGFTANRERKVIDGKRMTYFVIEYPAKEMREFMRKKDSCTRKYSPSIITYVVDTSTKRVLTKQRFVPYMPSTYYEEYLGLDITKTDTYGQFHHTSVEYEDIKPVPIELVVNTDTISTGDYHVWHTACVSLSFPSGTEKIVRCSAPFVGNWNVQ